jgi:shikimate dehydrogenase
VLNRSIKRAERLRDDLAPAPVEVLASDTPAAIDELRTAHVVINATALGWKRGETPLAPEQLDLLHPKALVVDITYRDTDLLEAARSRGLRTLDGLEMLVYQGARSLEIWTGMQPPVDIMMSAAVAARAARA